MYTATSNERVSCWDTSSFLIGLRALSLIFYRGELNSFKQHI